MRGTASRAREFDRAVAQLGVIREARSRYLPAEAPPASTLVGVTALAMDGLLIEVEATALTD